jgi:hypothetical protein
VIPDGKSVEICSDDGAACVRLSLERGGSDYDPDFFHVDVKAGAPLIGDHCVVTFNGDRLDGFFGELEERWRGWDGIRRWDAVEHGLSVEATHNGGVVELLFIVRRDFKPDAWELRVPILIAPGESLKRISSSIAWLLFLEPSY